MTAPFWFAFVGSAVFVVVIWRQLAHIAHADAAVFPGPESRRTRCQSCADDPGHSPPRPR
ncbi:MAG: hypothetical protein WKF47_12660 [Geodermatophilaceae bacterium]